MAPQKPEVGDLIEIFRGTFQHWAIYVGGGYVVHLTTVSKVNGAGSSSMMTSQTERGKVKKEKLQNVVGNNKWKINNCLDKEYKPREVLTIKREACALVGEELPYCVLKSNCEHFVNDLRYGKPESRQVGSVMADVKIMKWLLMLDTDWPVGAGLSSLVDR
uniref:LRAT domain-containing protein n=1 Tax=Salarias fasciatus TaxID=181472 RepID=A0A672J3K2_SALFA